MRMEMTEFATNGVHLTDSIKAPKKVKRKRREGDLKPSLCSSVVRMQ